MSSLLWLVPQALQGETETQLKPHRDGSPTLYASKQSRGHTVQWRQVQALTFSLRIYSHSNGFISTLSIYSDSTQLSLMAPESSCVVLFSSRPWEYTSPVLNFLHQFVTSSCDARSWSVCLCTDSMKSCAATLQWVSEDKLTTTF